MSTIERRVLDTDRHLIIDIGNEVTVGRDDQSLVSGLVVTFQWRRHRLPTPSERSAEGVWYGPLHPSREDTVAWPAELDTDEKRVAWALRAIADFVETSRYQLVDREAAGFFASLEEALSGKITRISGGPR